MNTVLRNQVRAANQSADELHQADHREAVFSFEVQDLIGTYVKLYERAQAAIRYWQDKARAAKPQDPGQAEAWAAREVEFFRPFDVLLREMAEGFESASTLVTAAERTGYVVDGKAAFESAFDDLRLVTSFEYDRVVRSAADARSGRARPVNPTELRDALRRQMDGRR